MTNYTFRLGQMHVFNQRDPHEDVIFVMFEVKVGGQTYGPLYGMSGSIHSGDAISFSPDANFPAFFASDLTGTPMPWEIEVPLDDKSNDPVAVSFNAINVRGVKSSQLPGLILKIAVDVTGAAFGLTNPGAAATLIAALVAGILGEGGADFLDNRLKKPFCVGPVFTIVDNYNASQIKREVDQSTDRPVIGGLIVATKTVQAKREVIPGSQEGCNTPDADLSYMIYRQEFPVFPLAPIPVSFIPVTGGALEAWVQVWGNLNLDCTISQESTAQGLIVDLHDFTIESPFPDIRAHAKGLIPAPAFSPAYHGDFLPSNPARIHVPRPPRSTPFALYDLADTISVRSDIRLQLYRESTTGFTRVRYLRMSADGKMIHADAMLGVKQVLH